MASFNSNVYPMIGLVLIIFSVAIVFPAVIINTDSPQTTAFEQTLDERTVITGGVSSRVNTLSESQDTISLTLLDKRSGEFNETGELQQGETANITIDGKTIQVTNIDVISGNEVLVQYTYPLYIGWPPGAQIFIENLGTLLLSMAVVFSIGVIFTMYGVYRQ